MLFRVSWFQMLYFLFYLLFSFILSFLFLFFRLFSSITFIFLILLWSLFCKYKTISQKDTHPLKLLSFIRKISNNLKYTVFLVCFLWNTSVQLNQCLIHKIYSTLYQRSRSMHRKIHSLFQNNAREEEILSQV